MLDESVNLVEGWKVISKAKLFRCNNIFFSINACNYRAIKISDNLLKESRKEIGLQQKRWLGAFLGLKMGAMIAVF